MDDTGAAYEEGGDLNDGPDGGSPPRSRDGKHRDGEWQRFSGSDSPDGVEKHSDRDRRRRSARDSPPARRERSRSSERGETHSVERNQISREESVERRSSKKRKEDGGNDEDTTEKLTRLLDETKEEEREVEKEGNRFGDGAEEDTGSLNGDHEEKRRRRDGRQPMDEIEEAGDSAERRKERNFGDGVVGEQLGYGEDRREEQGPCDVIKEEKVSDGEEGRVSAREERRGQEIPEDRKGMDELEEGKSKDRAKEEFGNGEEPKPHVSATGVEKFASEQRDFEKEASQNAEPYDIHLIEKYEDELPSQLNPTTWVAAAGQLKKGRRIDGFRDRFDTSAVILSSASSSCSVNSRALSTPYIEDTRIMIRDIIREEFLRSEKRIMDNLLALISQSGLFSQGGTSTSAQAPQDLSVAGADESGREDDADDLS